MTCPALSRKPYINILPQESAFCFFQLNCKLQLSQLKEPINSGPSGKTVQTMISTHGLRVVKDLWEGRKWLLVCYTTVGKLSTRDLKGSETVIFRNYVFQCEQITTSTVMFICEHGVGFPTERWVQLYLGVERMTDLTKGSQKTDKVLQTNQWEFC